MDEKLRENTIKLARFMCVEEEKLVLEHDLARYEIVECMHYHDDWLWIMPVVEKIIDVYDFEFKISKTNHDSQPYFAQFKRSSKVKGPGLVVSGFYGDSMVQTTFKACINFLNSIQ